jgi:UDP-N-acetylmuramoyl-tripeptide--D-alanyl-D-alanine ligase
MRFDVVFGDERAKAEMALLGRHNVSNAMAAIAVGLKSGISLADCVRAVSNLRAPDRRGQVLRVKGTTILNDCYNSNPEALRSMIETLAGMPGKRRILVAGEMLELGAESERLHRESGRVAAESGIDLIIGVRGNAQYLVQGARESGAMALFVPSSVEAGEWLKDEIKEGDVVLLKGSRGVGLEEALHWMDDLS